MVLQQNTKKIEEWDLLNVGDHPQNSCWNAYLYYVELTHYNQDQLNDHHSINNRIYGHKWV